ncbi:hypothetical protein [Stutzerimonas kunmingensis]|uniref:hypothetical protein n=1 Tax=Stutzerimonas kunmingensis TaxID=1211807 RepID=UPI0028A69B70|nr:hypothetical protein [Stutzerimonas kunmingensis]
MERFFNSMEYIDLGMACQWLCQLTEAPLPLPGSALMELCERYSTPVYIDCATLEGVIAPRIGTRFVMQQVIGIEHCRVDSPACAYEAFEPHKSGGIDVTGMAVLLSERDELAQSHVHSWTLTNQERRPFLFRPGDIKRLASFLKPDQDGKLAQSQVQAEKIVSPKTKIIEHRLEFIRRWFEEQQEYKSSQLSTRGTGLPGARNACWRWLTQSGLTSPGELFFGAKQNDSSQSKKFVNAWNVFLKEQLSD